MAEKINYGIDLGTTNSAIARIENGEAIIKKTDTLKDTMPSCISFTRRKTVLVGDAAVNILKQDKLRAMKSFDNNSSSTFIEFKRTMGTDKKFKSINMDTEYFSENLSSEVLKKLKSFIIDEELKSIVITVPAKFTINQKDATRRAAQLAGFRQSELLQEPIAASYAYGLGNGNSSDGYWLVFDFGGGTFDAALLKVQEAIIKVVDTDGDNYLGGKNLDYAIVDEIILRYLKQNYSINNILKNDLKREILREAMKHYAEETKIQLSFKDSYNILSDLGDIPGTDDNGKEFELDLCVTQDDLERVIGPIFQRSIDISAELLKRNNLCGNDLFSLILVGGPTYSPLLRNMLREQLTKNVDTSVDPMTVVAKGAALYASTVDVHEEILSITRDATKVRLDLGYQSTTVENEEFVSVKLIDSSIQNMSVELTRGDNAWSSGRIQLKEKGAIIPTQLNPGKSNLFNLFLYDETGNKISSEPSEIMILQGGQPPKPPLPYNIGIEIQSIITGELVFKSIKGLEKNQSLPATGVIYGLKTPKEIRPGAKEDFLKIPIYQGDYGADGKRASYNEHVYDVVITGEDLQQFLPENSEIDITIKVDVSEKMSLSAYFPFIEQTKEILVPHHVQTEINADTLQKDINNAKKEIEELKINSDANISNDLEKSKTELLNLEKLLEQGKGDYDRKKQIRDNLNRCLIKIDDIKDSLKWPKTENEVNIVLNEMDKTFKQNEQDLMKDYNSYNNIKQQMEEVRKQFNFVKNEKNPKLAEEIKIKINIVTATIMRSAQGPLLFLFYFIEFQNNFNQYPFKDRNKAKTLIDRGISVCFNLPGLVDSLNRNDLIRAKEILRPVEPQLGQIFNEIILLYEGDIKNLQTSGRDGFVRG
jgi:molecular chaperone DnaK